MNHISADKKPTVLSPVETNSTLKQLVEKASMDPDLLAVSLFGSQARGDAGPASDWDVCLFLPQGKKSNLALSQKKLDYQRDYPDLDIHVFQQLPLYIQSRVLSEGKPLFTRDEDRFYELAFRTLREFELFRPRYEAYLEAVAHG